jgi:hypothetical protein
MKKRYGGTCLLVVACMLMLSACKLSGSNSTQSDAPSTKVSSNMPEVKSPPTDWDKIPDSDFEYRYDSELKGVVITKYHGNATKVRFPDTINGDPVVGLEYLGYTAFVAVSIPNSVVRIGNSAFTSCDGLTSITIPNSVTSIGIRAFKDCHGLTSITIPNNVTSVGNRAFSSCIKLTNIKIPDTVKLEASVFDNTYWYNRQPDGVIYLGNVLYGYKGTLSEKTVTIRDGVTSIAAEAFKEGKDLTSVTIPDSVTSIGEYAFSGCSKLDEATKSRILKINPKVEF